MGPEGASFTGPLGVTDANRRKPNRPSLVGNQPANIDSGFSRLQHDGAGATDATEQRSGGCLLCRPLLLVLAWADRRVLPGIQSE
jgi:hypothetical protein